MKVDVRRRLAVVTSSLTHGVSDSGGGVRDTDSFEPVRRGYRALGFGANADVLAMLDQSGPEPACWQIHSLDVRRVRSRPAGEVAALALFGGLPEQFELASVQVRTWSPDARLAHLVVGGSYRVRIRGTAETIDLPFSLVWSFTNGRVKEVRNLAEGFELRRLSAGAACAA